MILVYNADSGFFNSIKDGLRKAISPATYQCNLCTLIYGTVTMREQWKKFIEDLELPTKFVYRDEFFRMLKNHPHKITDTRFPVIFLGRNYRIFQIADSEEINRCKTLEELMILVT